MLGEVRLQANPKCEASQAAASQRLNRPPLHRRLHNPSDHETGLSGVAARVANEVARHEY